MGERCGCFLINFVSIILDGSPQALVEQELFIIWYSGHRINSHITFLVENLRTAMKSKFLMQLCAIARASQTVVKHLTILFLVFTSPVELISSSCNQFPDH